MKTTKKYTDPIGSSCPQEKTIFSTEKHTSNEIEIETKKTLTFFSLMAFDSLLIVFKADL